MTSRRATNRWGATKYARFISVGIANRFGLRPLDETEIASLVYKLQRLKLEVAAENAVDAYSPTSTEELTRLLGGLGDIIRFLDDPRTAGAQSRYQTKRLQSGISVVGWLAQANEVYALIRPDANFAFSPKEKNFKTLRVQMIGKTLPDLYRAFYPRQPFEMKFEVALRERWGPGPLFVAFVARYLGFGPVNGEQIRKARQRASQKIKGTNRET